MATPPARPDAAPYDPSDPSTTLLLTGAVRRPLELVQRDGPLQPLLALAEPIEEADHATVSSRDGLFRASVPVAWLRTGRLEEGRLRIPDAPTKCWSVKDVVSIQLTVGAREDSVRPGTFTAPATSLPAGA